MTKTAIAVCVVACGIATAAGAAWSRFQVQSVSGITFRGQPVPGYQAVYVTDAVNPELCLLVLRDTATGYFSTTVVPRISCDVHGAAQ